MSRVSRLATYALGLATLVCLASSTVFAGRPVPSPEVDGSTLSTGFGLLAAGALIVRSRMRSK